MRSVAARLVALLLPVLVAGLFCRTFYTPDEPREASLVVAMASQYDASLPELGGQTFAEKPPLLYWLGGASVKALGASAAVTRLPNVLYLLLTALAIGALARRASGEFAGLVAGVAAATMLQVYLALVWLATDAPLVAGVAVALAGMYEGLTAATRESTRRGYAVMYAGLLLAFFAKGLAGWMVPVCAYLTVIVLERRWRDLVRPLVSPALPVMLLVIGGWVFWVLRRPDGAESLKVLFWYNLVGRAVALDAPASYAYAAGHGNSPGKYLLELPIYLLPWTVPALAALVRGLRQRLPAGGTGTAWRLSLGALVLPFVLLSFAATARGVYFAPPALGFALMLGLFAAEREATSPESPGPAFRVGGGVLAVYALLLTLVASLLIFAPRGRDGFAIASGIVAIVSGALAIGLSLRKTRSVRVFVLRQLLAAVLVLSGVAGPLYLRLNPVLSLEATAGEVRAMVGSAPLGLYRPDETTTAMGELYLGHPADLTVAIDRSSHHRPVASARLLYLIPGSGRWNLARWLGYLGYGPETVAPRLVGSPIPGMVVAGVIERPGGRAYALLRAVSDVTEDGTP